jgi:outer membrane receptor protein involved in Fe transport
VSRALLRILLCFTTIQLGYLVSPANAQRSVASSGELPAITVTPGEPSPRKPERTRRRPDRSAVPIRLARPLAADGASGASTSAQQSPSPSRSDLSSAVTALPAAVTVVDAAAIARTPVTTYGDLFRALPGFNVSNFGQGGIGYGLALRGYTEAEHGRDIAYLIDGVPVNAVSSLHTPNYADLNILLPETIKSIAVVRGPFSVEAGDSNLGGSVEITTKDAEPAGSVSIAGGSQGTVRSVGTWSNTEGTWRPYLAIEGYRTDGYRDNSFVERYNAFNKVSTTLADGATLSIRGQAFGTTFGAPGYVNRDALAAGTVNERSATNRSDGGDRALQNLVANYVSGAAGQELKGTLYVSHDTLNRYADFGGGQRWQHDDRVTAGGRLSKVWTGAGQDTLPVQLLVGGSWRSDVISAFQAPATARVVSGAPVVDLGLTQHDLAAYSQLQVKPLPWLKLTGALRYDQFIYDITDRLTPGGTPNIAPGILSPKAGVAITPLAGLELFANYGQGFRSIDVPLELIGNPSVRPFKVASLEGGAQLTAGLLRLLADIWTSDSRNEIFQPAPGLPVTLLGRARREGFDLDGRFALLATPAASVALFANYSGVTARLLDAAPSYYVPNVPDYVANVGLDYSLATRGAERLSGSAYVTFVGRKNLTQDGAITAAPYSRVAAKLAYAWPDGWTAFSTATWYPGNRTSEIAINFGNPTGATSADIFVSPQPALVVQAGVSYRFPTGPLAAAQVSP